MNTRVIICVIAVIIVVALLWWSSREHLIMPDTILIPPAFVPAVAPRFPELTVTSPASAPVLRRANPRP